MKTDDLNAIKARLGLWQSGINALGSDSIAEDRQRAADQFRLVQEVEEYQNRLSLLMPILRRIHCVDSAEDGRTVHQLVEFFESCGL